MTAVRYSDAAKADLRRIWLDIAEDSARNADRVVDRLIEVSELLGRHSHLGELWGGRHSEVRFFPVPGNDYVIFFQPQSTGVEIRRIIHGRRNLELLLPRE